MEGYIYDYRLGYIRDGCALTGFDVYGGDNAPNGRIVALGGYTTPGQVRGGKTWAECLYDKLYGKYQILSGCTDGYSSAQILIMFLREAILLKPKLVICLSGFYNIAYKLGLIQNEADAELLRTHPFATPGHLHFYKKIMSRFWLGNNEIFYGLENHSPAWETWLRHMAEINCVCDEFDIMFRAFLQPSIFSDHYVTGERETAFLREHYVISDEDIARYRGAFRREYAEVSERIGDIGYITDISGVFDACEDVYKDAYHVKDDFLPTLTEGMIL